MSRKMSNTSSATTGSPRIRWACCPIGGGSANFRPSKGGISAKSWARRSGHSRIRRGHRIAQELEFLLELAKLYRDSDEACFLIIGEGNRFKAIADTAREESLTNVIFRGKVTSNEFAALLRHCDIGLINLNRRFTIPITPPRSWIISKHHCRSSPRSTRLQISGPSWLRPTPGSHCRTGDIKAYKDGFEKLLVDPELRAKLAATAAIS